MRSIVGNFLEHNRIFYFYNDGNPEVFMGSADWMPRNLDRRVEIVFPVIEEELKEKALHILHVELEDNVKARVMQPDGVRHCHAAVYLPAGEKNDKEYSCGSSGLLPACL